MGPHVDGEHRIPVLGRGPRHPAAAADTGVEHEAIQTPESFRRIFDARRRHSGVRDVTDQDDSVAAALLHHRRRLLGGGFVHVETGQFRAFLRCENTYGAAVSHRYVWILRRAGTGSDDEHPPPREQLPCSVRRSHSGSES